jgi:hypothetical protein
MRSVFEYLSKMNSRIFLISACPVFFFAPAYAEGDEKSELEPSRNKVAVCLGVSQEVVSFAKGTDDQLLEANAKEAVSYWKGRLPEGASVELSFQLPSELSDVERNAIVKEEFNECESLRLKGEN